MALQAAPWMPPLDTDRFLRQELPAPDATPVDVLFVGAGPAGLAGAIRLGQLVRSDRASGGPLAGLEIGVLEKAAEIGGHCLSGAVIDPEGFRVLFPDLPDSEFPFAGPVGRERVCFLTRRGRVPLPVPPTMRNHGRFTASLCEMTRWLGEKAEELGVSLFPGFPVESLLWESGAVHGVRTVAAGLNRDGTPGPNWMPPMDVSARVTVLGEGARGPLTGAWLAASGAGGPSPQTYALGVKELWETSRDLGMTIHTMGWPLPPDVFGGSFIYPMGQNLSAVGMVAGLDAPYRDLDVHALLQEFKRHPWVASLLKGGQVAEWGAKTIPEGGYYSIPTRLSGDGVVIAGDAAGLVDVASLKGIHYAMRSGIFAAEAIADSLRAEAETGGTGGPLPGPGLAAYDERLRVSVRDGPIYRNRNMRLAFKAGIVRGGAKAAVMQLTGGAFPGGSPPDEDDAAVARPLTLPPGGDGGKLGQGGLSKVDAAYLSGNQTRDDIPSHLVVGETVPPRALELYASLCPAGVYERDGSRLVVNAPNCIDCRATDVLGPRWSPREGGSGPSYRRM